MEYKLGRLFWIFVMSVFASCSVSRFIPEGEYLLEDVEVISDSKDVRPSEFRGYVRQNPNSSWFSIVKVPLRIYALSGTDTTKWINRFIQKIGDKPVIYDSASAERSKEHMRRAMQNLGYMRANVDILAKKKKKKIELSYVLHPGKGYVIRSWRYDVKDRNLKNDFADYSSRIMSENMLFNVNMLDMERQALTAFFQNRGYYKFNKELITCTADTVSGSSMIDLNFHIAPYVSAGKASYQKFHMGNINVFTDFDIAQGMRMHDFEDWDSIHYKSLNVFSKKRPFLRPEVLYQNIFLVPGELYSERLLQRSQSALGSLNAVKYSDLRFAENENDSTVLDCFALLSRNNPNSFSAEIEGTNSAGDLGAAASVSYQNRNLFRGSELFTFKIRGAYEAVTGLQGYSNENYIEYGVETSISFPRFLFPFISSDLRKRILATSEVSLQFNSQDRPEFSRRAASVSWSYKWTYRQRWRHSVDLLDLNYVYMPWISSAFRQEYLDNVNNQNSILKYNYENLLIMKIGYGFTYHSGGANLSTTTGNSYSVRFNIESSGNLLYGLSHLFNAGRNDSRQYTLMNIAYAQYIKTDFNFAKSFMIDDRNSIVFHVGTGVAFPYGNSRILPFEKRYFSGGANSVRGWLVRRLGPGSFSGNDANIDFINQSGDIKLDINLEYRTKLFWKLNGAFFIDAGNIWTIRGYDEQPGGAFRMDSFYKEMALAYGLGLRFDFDYFILRFDGGMKAVNPAKDAEERCPLVRPDLGRDFAFHFAVGYPF